MEIRLDLKKHCIETAMRKQYELRMSRYFRDAAERDRLQTEMELLLKALETFDFSFLRHTYPELEGKGVGDVFLETDHRGQPVIRLNGVWILQ